VAGRGSGKHRGVEGTKKLPKQYQEGEEGLGAGVGSIGKKTLETSQKGGGVVKCDNGKLVRKAGGLSALKINRERKLKTGQEQTIS